MSRRRRILTLGITLAAVATGGSLFAVGMGNSAGRPPFGTWAPGVAAPATALARLPIAMSSPPQITRLIQRAVETTGGDLTAATSSLRVAGVGLGVSHSSLYVYSPGQGALCLIVWPRDGACPTLEKTDHPGLLFTFSPGGPGYPGLPASTPPAIAGIAADNIATVEFRDNGDLENLVIAHNVFFQEIPSPPPAGTPWTMTLEVTYVGGKRITISIPDVRASSGG